MSLRLVIEHSPVPQPKGEHRHDGGEMTIGRGADCDWRIEDPEQVISRRHCVISGGAGRWTVTDMSSGGLYVDGSGRPLGPGNSANIENGTRLRLGDVLIRAELAEARVATPQAAAKPAREDDFFAPREAPPPPPPRPESLPPPFEGERRPFTEPVRATEAPPQFDDPFTLGTADLRRREALVDPPPGGGGVADKDPFGFGVTFGHEGSRGGGAAQGAGTDDWGFGLGQLGGGARVEPERVADPPSGGSDSFGDWGLGSISSGQSGSGGTGRAAERAIEPQMDRDAGPNAAARGVATDDPFGLGSVSQPDARARVRNPDAADASFGAGDAGKTLETPPLREAPTGSSGPALSDAGPGLVTAEAAPGAPVLDAAAEPRAIPPPTEGTSDLLAAFLRGAGLDGAALTPDDMEALGRRFRAMADGLILLLRTRAQEKNSVRVSQTVFGARDMNPLKFAATPEEGVASLIAHRGKGYLEPDAAIEAALRDLTDHQLRTWTGLQTALRRMIDRFDPALFEAEVEDVGMLKSLIAGSRPARLWQLYTERYRDIATAAEGRFLGEVGADFRDAYEGSKGENK
jgi:type VI secretion system FHA domain protein